MSVFILFNCQTTEADFVCIEPWYGRTDNDGFTGDLKDKAGECKLSANNEKIYLME